MWVRIAIQVCRVAIKWNVGEPLLRLNDFLYLNSLSNNTCKHGNKVNNSWDKYQFLITEHFDHAKTNVPINIL